MELLTAGQEVPEGFEVVTELLTDEEIQRLENFAVGRANFAVMQHLEHIIAEHRWMKIVVSELTTQGEELETELTTLRAASDELLLLKDDLKQSDPEEYERRKETAWEAMRKARGR